MKISELEERREALLRKLEAINAEIRFVEEQITIERAKSYVPLLNIKFNEKSKGKILFRGIVIEILRQRKIMSSSDLYRSAIFYIGAINENTFRSYIRRMRIDNLIEKTPGGSWVLSKEFEKNDIFP